MAVGAVDKHQVIDDAACLVEQQPVALAAACQADHINRQQGFQRSGCIGPNQAQLAHVRHVKQAGSLAGVVVLGQQTGRVLHRHAVAGKRHHAGAQSQMQVVQGGLKQFIRREIHGAFLDSQMTGTRHDLGHGWPPLSVVPERFAGLTAPSLWRSGLRVAPSVGGMCCRLSPVGSHGLTGKISPCLSVLLPERSDRCNQPSCAFGVWWCNRS